MNRYLLAMVVLSGCGKPGIFWCDDISEASLCWQYDDKEVTNQLMEEECITGTIVEQSSPSSPAFCPDEGAIAECASTFDGKAATTTYYSTGGAPFDATTAQAACDDIGGTFKELQAETPTN